MSEYKASKTGETVPRHKVDFIDSGSNEMRYYFVISESAGFLQ
jgi:hypothetical protein